VSDQLFIVLRVCLLALVYLVFLRVLRAVWVELRAEAAVPAGNAAPARPSRPAPVPSGAPTPTPSPTMVPTGGARLTVVAPASLAGRSFTLDGETTIGRGAGCGVSIDDAHVSKLHARLAPRDGQWYLEDLGSTNGTVLDGDHLVRPTPIRRGGRITIGDVVLELT
jgi:hypothetical protein